MIFADATLSHRAFDMLYPVRQSSRDGSTRSLHGRTPKRWWACQYPRSSPGTPIARGPDRNDTIINKIYITGTAPMSKIFL